MACSRRPLGDDAAPHLSAARRSRRGHRVLAARDGRRAARRPVGRGGRDAAPLRRRRGPPPRPGRESATTACAAAPTAASAPPTAASSATGSSEDVILDCAHKAVEFGYGTLVMQAGEDYGIDRGVDGRRAAPHPLGDDHLGDHAEPGRAPGRGPRRSGARPAPTATCCASRPRTTPCTGASTPTCPAGSATGWRSCGGCRSSATRPARASWSASPARRTPASPTTSSCSAAWTWT